MIWGEIIASEMLRVQSCAATDPWPRRDAQVLGKLIDFALPRRRHRLGAASARPRPVPPMRPNHVRAYNFIFDACANGQQIKCLTVIDELPREWT